MRAYICLFSLVLFLSATTIFAQNQNILTIDFEKGTQRWEARGSGNVSIKTSKKHASNGKKSLRVSGRKESWQGSQLNVTEILKANTTYEFTVSVKLGKKQEPDKINLTMERGNNKFSGIGEATANADGWTTVTGRFKPDGKDQYLLVYVEAGRERTSFYIDNFKIDRVVEIPNQKGVLITSDFEDRTAQNWFVRGSGVQIFSTTAGGSRSLKVANRRLNSHGVGKDLSPNFYKGRTYQISVDLKLVGGQTPDKFKVGMQQTAPDGEKTYVEIVPLTEVTDAKWVTLKGLYKATTWGNNLIIYVESEGNNSSYYLDNFVLSMPSP